ncbi:MAG: type II toxin-antitoxin system HicB family antitoxin [Chloroflexi bacterium]|nr:type II toxin-antitoxin system HicB family antitoxin [Chloroflexota bacterium]
MRFLVTLERGEDGYVVVECPALPGCVSQGKTEEEALANIKDAIVGILEVRRKHGLPFPEVHTSEVEVAGPSLPPHADGSHDCQHQRKVSRRIGTGGLGVSPR